MITPNFPVSYVRLDGLPDLPGSDDEVVRVYFVRHGESALNISQNGVRYTQGQSPHVELTEKGKWQAVELAEKMASKIGRLQPLLVTSTAIRAIDTARCLANRLGLSTTAYTEFLELGSGTFEGKSKEDPGYKADYGRWEKLSPKEKWTAPKVSVGESYSEVAERALDGLSKVLGQLRQKETVFVYGHLMLMNAVAIELTGIELSQEPRQPLPELRIQNGDLMMLEIPRGGSVKEGRVRSVIRS